ncbi:uncharacterized protein RCO7_11297 [Rhynchosporium graminicola]|uniref:Uncharacterized protein n=1 Tax=Rhynchosporium graminicola TaxID=2792576 RepID=A0A1E1LNP3_9HELO|nr:uncharacterized protein RCO7_11297 [Rhynchosporium commune]
MSGTSADAPGVKHTNGCNPSQVASREISFRYYIESDTSYTGIPIDLGPSIYPSSYMIFSTILVIASKSGDNDIVPRSTIILYINRPNQLSLIIKYTILSSLLPSSEAKDAELNRGEKVFKELEFIKEFIKKAIFKAIISNTREKRNLPSSSEIASDLDTPGPSLKKKARRISYYTRSTARATLVNLDKELDIVIPIPDIPDLLEAPETLGEKASKVEVVEEVEF